MCQCNNIYLLHIKQLAKGDESYENKIRRPPKNPPRTAVMRQIFPLWWCSVCDETSDTATKSAF